MKRKALISLFLFVLAASTLSTAKFAELSKANPTLPEKYPMEQGYIRSNGDIDPPTLPINRSGNVYALTGNIVNYTIEIQKDNIVIDGNGFSLKIPPHNELDEASMPISKIGNPSINISSRNNIIVKNTRFDNCFFCIWVENSSNIIIIQNTMTNGNLGVYMTSSANCSIIGNKIIDTGLKIEDTTLLNIAYNNISRNKNYGVQLSVNYSSINRNDFVENFETGLYLISPNLNNRVFENNFLNNEVGLLFRGDPGTNVNNSVFNNYWSNNQEAIKNVYYNGAPYDTSDKDQSPRTNSISTTFEPTLFPLPSFALDDPKPFPTVLVTVASGASVVIIGIGLLVYFKKRKQLSETPKKVDDASFTLTSYRV